MYTHHAGTMQSTIMPSTSSTATCDLHRDGILILAKYLVTVCDHMRSPR
jgi:hypothetical protein